MFRLIKVLALGKKTLQGGERDVSRLFLFFMRHSILFSYLCPGYEIIYTYSKLFPDIHRLTEKNI